MGRHSAPRRTLTSRLGRPGHTTLTAAGAAAALTGVALLLSPAPPVTAQAGSVLGAPVTSGRSSQGQASGPTATSPTVSVPLSAAAADPESQPVLSLGFTPDRLVVEALAVDSPLVPTLADADGDFVPPDDPTELGWWRGVRPGSGAGSVLVAGHIDSARFGQGPLARLVDLRTGDRAVVTGPGEYRADYVVRGVETFPKDELPAGELFGVDGPERLVLVTCGGTFDRRKGSWDSNIVAVLDPVPPA